MTPGPTTVILPLDLGAANRFQRHVFPLAYRDGGNNLSRGSLLLSATLDEMTNIKQLGTDLASSEQFLYNTRIKYESLVARRAKLQKNRSTLNPYKAFKTYRAARVFHDASLTLYLETKETSERIQREQWPVQTVPSAEMHVFNDTVPDDAIIDGIAIDLPDGLAEDDAIQEIMDAANMIVFHATEHPIANPDEYEALSLAETSAESTLSDLPDDYYDEVDDQTSASFSTDTSEGDTSVTNPSSPQQVHYHYHRSVLVTNSNVTGLTMNNSSNNSSGASISQSSS